jgi:hypothetical protein
MQVKLPPPPAAPMMKVKLPPPVPQAAPIQTKRPAPAMQVKLPEPPRAKPRLESFAPASGPMDFDDPFLGPQLRPNYIQLFQRMFSRGGFDGAAENGASRSLNLLLTCSIALLMLAAVLRF